MYNFIVMEQFELIGSVGTPSFSCQFVASAVAIRADHNRYVTTCNDHYNLSRQFRMRRLTKAHIRIPHFLPNVTA